MNAGDLFIFTTLSGTGSISRRSGRILNQFAAAPSEFFNPKSVQIILKRVGFDILKTSTPGKLDIDILCNNIQYIKDRFWRTFVLQALGEGKTGHAEIYFRQRLEFSHACRLPKVLREATP